LTPYSPRPHRMRLRLHADFKVNLFLEVVGVRQDGYHDLVSIFLRCLGGDVLAFDPNATSLRVECDGCDIPLESNLVYRALRAFSSALCLDLGEMGWSFSLHKVIPPGSGLGGGSADAALVLRLLERFLSPIVAEEKLEEVSSQLARSLGADVFFLYRGLRSALAVGRGDALVAEDPIGFPLYVCVVLPSYSYSTAESYRLLDELSSQAFPPEGEALSAAWNLVDAVRKRKALGLLPNAFHRVAEALNPKEHALVLRSLEGSGFPLYAMSGSGSSYFGICYSEDELMDKTVRLAGALRSFPASLLVTRSP